MLLLFELQVFLDAPHLLTPVDPQGAPIFSTAPQFEKLTHLDPQQPTNLTPRAWYFHLRDAQDVWAVSQSLVYIRNFIEKEGPFQVRSILTLFVVAYDPEPPLGSHGMQSRRRHGRSSRGFSE